MFDAQDTASEMRKAIRLSLVPAILLLVLGYSVATQGESATGTAPRAQAAMAAGQPELAPAPYFPAQYVNQATEVEAFIPTF